MGKLINILILYSLVISFHIVRSMVGLVIYLHWKLYKYDLTEQDIINSSIVDDVNITNHYGEASITATHIKKRCKVYKLVLVDGSTLECASDHRVCTEFGYVKYVAHVKKGDIISTKNGGVKVKSIKNKYYSTFMFDMTVATEDHLYYTGNILSMNSIISAIFLVWYLLNHTDRNILCVSVNGNKVKELMEKIKTILKGLEFYMKPGIEVNNVMSMKFDSGCNLVSETTSERSGASFTIHVLYSDEFALVPHNYIKEFFRTLYPSLSSSEIAKMIITSTPRGMNKFYEIYNDAIHSKNRFNPIRTDWYEVPLQDDKGNPLLDEHGNIRYRGEDWKKDQINDLGSEEDFNQEFGCQFLSGSSMLFKSNDLRKLKAYQTKFIHHEIEDFDEDGLEYEGLLTWHPLFNMDNLKNEACKFVISIDLADGNGGDYSVINILQVLPMSAKEIESIEIFRDEKDFFKLVQIGMFRDNHTQLSDLANIFYHLITRIMIQENIRVVLEMNHEGNYFRNLSVTLYGDNNELEEDSLYIRFKARMADQSNHETYKSWRIGLTNNEKTKSYAIKIIKDKIKYNQLVLIEWMTIEEGLSFAKNKSGEYESQTGNDDCIMTCINVVHVFDSNEYVELIDDLMQYCSKEFFDLIGKKMNIDVNANKGEYTSDDDYADLL